ncbi:hypothetical protein GX586_01135 [bacterium]|nr:hypothetical protein [bacterium]
MNRIGFPAGQYRIHACVFAAACVACLAASPPVWWEGEDATVVPEQAKRFCPTVESEGFSGGRMLHASMQKVPDEGVTLRWEITTPGDGVYALWGRLGYRPWSSHQWRFDDQPWNEFGTSYGFFEFIKVPTEQGLAEACWAPYANVTLSAGVHRFEIRIAATETKAGFLQSFDCFALAREPFVPAGRFRPDDTIPVNVIPGTLADNTWWPLHPRVDAAQQPAVDLSFMNDAAGAHGFVTMKDGELLFEDGTPVRFWGPNVSYWQGNLVYMEHMAADTFAAFLARLGVNIVRIHVLHAINSLIDDTRNDTQEFDQGKLDRLDYLIAALGRRGIYVNIDLMYHRTFKPGDEVGEELIVPEGGGRRGDEYNVSWACGAASFWHPRVIELNLELYRKLLTHVNPYTKKSLAEMPQMAMCTIHNEQSIFWGTSNMRRGRTAEILDEIFAAWLARKYGTHEKLAAAWQAPGQPSPFDGDENLDDGRVKVGTIVMGAHGRNARRAADQVAFLYEMETGFYQRVIAAMRSWGVKCPLITSNWQGGGNTTRLVLQASTLGEVVDRHIYFSRPVTMLDSVGKGLPMIGFDQQAGRAFSVSEWNHGSDGRYMAETVPLMATVGAVQGWDALFQFCAGTPTWPSGLGSITPGHYALYPFAAMIFRRGDIAQGPVVFERRRDPAYQFSSQPESRSETTDPAALRFRDAGGSDATPRVPAEVLAIGRVQNAYVDAPTNDLLDTALIARCRDATNGVVSSAAGDVAWHYGGAYVLLKGARTQGAFGALAGRALACPDVTIMTSNAHAALLVTALDARPIRSSTRLLAGAVGRAQGNGVRDPRTGGLVSTPPCLIEPVTGELRVRTALTNVHAVSYTGYRLARVPARRDGAFLVVPLAGQPGVMYYEIAE